MNNLEVVRKMIKNKGLVEVAGKKIEIGFTFFNHLLTEDILEKLTEDEKLFVNKFSEYLVLKSKIPWNIKLEFNKN